MVKTASFVLNLDMPKEKLLEWHFKSGFRSEDSDDEITVFRRSERQYYRNIKREHGEDSTILLKRQLMPFERLILQHLGGKRLLKDLMGKKIDDNVEFVYDYMLTKEKFDSERLSFLKVKDRETFNTRYSIERENQANAMNDDEDLVKGSLFAGELIEL